MDTKSPCLVTVAETTPTYMRVSAVSTYCAIRSDLEHGPKAIHGDPEDRRSRPILYAHTGGGAVPTLFDSRRSRPRKLAFGEDVDQTREVQRVVELFVADQQNGVYTSRCQSSPSIWTPSAAIRKTMLVKKTSICRSKNVRAELTAMRIAARPNRGSR